jgi:RNA recognition motif-containing protein
MATRLFVGNLAYRTTEETLQGLFSGYGTVKAVNVITDRESGRSKGFAFVEMTTDAEAQAATAGLNGKSVDDRQITVAEAQPRAEGGERRGGFGGERRGGGGGGFGGDRRGGGGGGFGGDRRGGGGGGRGRSDW